MTAQQLKNSILQMAVQGKLVPQDPNDEPASVLLERIRAEKEQLIKQKKIKREKNPSIIFKGADNTPYEKVGDKTLEFVIPYDIPETWEWVRFSAIAELQSGQDLAPDKYNASQQGIPYITGASNIEAGKVIINRWTENGRAFAYKGDLLITCKGTVGTMAVLLEEQVHIARQIMAIRPYCGIDLTYLQLVLDTLVAGLKAAAKSMIPGIAREDVLYSLIPIPPYAEQKRIVQRYTELMPHLSAYDAVERNLRQLNATFPEQLKKSILQEAVQGKLVPQDEEDESASILLKRIRSEKEALIKSGKIKRDKHESIIFRRDNSHYEKLDGIERCIDEEIPFEIPENWAWTRIRNICEAIVDCPHSTPKYYTEDTGYYSIDTTCIESDGRLSGLRYTDQHAYEERTTRLVPKENDIVYTREGSIGRAALLPHIDNLCLGQRVMLLRLSAFTDNRLYQYVLMSPLVLDAITSKIRGIGAKHINVSDVCNALIPVPPIAEQRRIVTALQNSLVLVNKV